MIIVPQGVTSWLYSNIPEEYPEYDPDTTYIYEDLDSVTSASVARVGGFYYKSSTSSNTGNNPITTIAKYWTKFKVANTHAMLDQQSLTKTEIQYTQADADYLSTDTQTNIPAGSKVWDVTNLKMYKAIPATNDLPNTDFTDEALWENISDIIVEFARGNIDSIILGYLETSSVKIEHFTYGTDGTDGVVIPEATQTISYSVNEDVYDLWDHIYSRYTLQIDRNQYVSINPIGYKIRVTIERNISTLKAACGFLNADESVDMGETSNKVPFNPKSYTRVTFDDFGTAEIKKLAIQDVVSFTTNIEKIYFSRKKRKIKEIEGTVVCFVLDPEDTNEGFEFLITFGIVQEHQITAEVAEIQEIKWSVIETI